MTAANTSALSTPQPDPTPAAVTSFAEHPAIAATWQAMSATVDGFKSVWMFEQENKFGQSVSLWLFDILKAVLLPSLNLLWLGLSRTYQIASKPKTKAAIVARYWACRAWLAPKVSYEKDAEQLTLPTD